MFNYIHVNSETNFIQSIVQVSEELSNPEYIQTRDYNDSIIGRIFISIDENGVPVLAPVVVVDPQDKPEFWWIDVGAFFDRFGINKWAILQSDDAAVKALITDTSVRRYIDLKRADLPGALQILVAKGFELDVDAILTAPPTDEERHVRL
ncbi:hypothetical protein [Acidovorax sp. NCPPB 3576]|uniref:hypothetical protein n=1 Tax=Acidovorax sp. NCPPB 3576 TaxID=2940488 RepID=UPI00234B5253|nr:hypothetical protein [Acidovorax sp. NCPPB 3576]WCM88854.1 hypothetical protein M5C98_02020 [Acidovorax sp. NCPPB 3576]